MALSAGDEHYMYPPTGSRGQRRRDRREWARRYRATRTTVSATLSRQEAERLLRLERRYEVGFTGLLRLGMEALERQRPSEARDKVRIVVPDWVARYSARALMAEAEALLDLARRQSPTRDGRLRAQEFRQEAGGYLDAAAWHSDVVRQYDRLAETPPPPAAQPDPATMWRTLPRTTARPTTVGDS